jgi:hypothetical protein
MQSSRLRMRRRVRALGRQRMRVASTVHDIEKPCFLCLGSAYLHCRHPPWSATNAPCVEFLR